ncbi:proton-coupled zinc antiporter SLC30A1 isoform X1 [Onthophagus taurus]|uniref:proton-coupled zinc antiporter SLC30A1 isoform X1 n=1 Tax=Onthophagus taurus TaxID=166361 RepID=UPI0039BE5A57
MPVKQWFRKFQPAQLYIVLTMTVVFFVTELVISHVTHSLTLLMDSYQTLCNIFALTGCVMTIKHGKDFDKKDKNATPEDVKENIKHASSECVGAVRTKSDANKSITAAYQEKKLKNTFGWARIDVLTLVICCIFLASLIFSLLVEAIQTLVHIDHTDEMHQPIMVGSVGVTGLILNAICYFLIGGYTFHQGSFLYVTESGDVVLDKVVTGDSIKQGGRRLSRTRTVPPPQRRERQSCREILRDITCSIIVILCSIIIYFTEAHIAKFIDPILAVVSSIIVLVLSFPYMKESCLILLQTIPASIDIDALKKTLLAHFPDIINVHDFHVWQLTANKVISTVHIIFQNPKVYETIKNDINRFFEEQGITQVTIQPEFFPKSKSTESIVSQKDSCLVKCQEEACKTNHCCPELQDEDTVFITSSSQNIAQESSTIVLTSVKVESNEFNKKPGVEKIEKIEKISAKIEKMIDEDKPNCSTNLEGPEKVVSQSIEENVLIVKQ